MNVFDLSAKISLDSSDYDRSLQMAKDAAEKFATHFVMATKAIGGGIVSLGKQAYDNFSNFQQLEGGIETLFGAQGKSFEDWAETFEQSSDGMQEYIDVARKVLNGDFGVGSDRKDLLSQAGYDPDTVQQMVNNLLSGVDVSSGVAADTIAANMQTAEEKYNDLIAAQDYVMNRAAGAFATAGMSMSEYMENVSGFAAALQQSTDSSYEAAQVADMAMIDMADNAAKLGTPLANIQAAYQGFAKQNYTMLDNLKLGYGGTKTEMERLLADAQKITGVKYDINNLKDVYEAIHTIQEETGIAGTVTEEAEHTIQGSSQMMRAAWQNVLTTMVTGGERLTESINDLVYSARTFVRNAAPAFKAALDGVGALIAGLVPEVLAILPGIVEELVPGFVNAITDIVGAIMDVMPDALEALKTVTPIVTNALKNFVPSIIAFLKTGIPQFVSTGLQMLTSLVSGFADDVPALVPQLTQAMTDIVDQLINIVETDGANLAGAGLSLMKGLADAAVKAVPNVLTQVTQLVQDLTASITSEAEGSDGNFITAGTAIISDLVDGLMTSIPTLVPELTSAVTEFITTFANLAGENTTSLANSAITILNSLVTSLGDAGTIQSVMTDITTAVMAIIDAIIDVITGLDVVTFANACVSIVTQLADGIVGAVSEITKKLPDLITKIVEWLTNPENLTGLLEAAVTLFGELVADIPGIIIALTEGLAGIVKGIADYFTNHGDEILDGLKEGFTNVGTKMTEAWNEKIKPAFENLGKFFTDFFLQFDWGQTFLDFVGSIGDAISAAWDDIKDAFTGEDGFGAKIASWFGEIDFLEAAKKLVSGIRTGLTTAWEDIKSWFVDKFTHLFDDIDLSKLAFWKRWGKKDGEETPLVDENGEMLDMPENMLTLDYDDLQPIPEDTLESYTTLRDAILDINGVISGGEDGGGLSTALSGLPQLFTDVLTAAQALSGFFGGGLINGIKTLIQYLCQTTTDEEGNVNAGGGNTLYTSLGSVFGLFEDILATSQLLAGYWTTGFIQASEQVRGEAGLLTGVIEGLSTAAQAGAAQFLAMAQEIYGVIDAYLALLRVQNGGGGGGNGKSVIEARASGGAVRRGQEYMVGEEGPEFFTPRRSGYIVPNDRLQGRGQTVNVSINGNIYGESYLRDYVVTTLLGTIRKEIRLAD